MLDPIVRRARRPSSRLSPLALTLAAVLILVACGGDDDSGAQIEWKPGTPPALAATDPTPAPDQQIIPTEPAGEEPAPDQTPPSADEAPTDGTPPPADSASTEQQPTGPLTAEQRVELQPNELGQIPIIEYHNFTTDPEKEDQFTRPIEKFRDDLEWLYERDFFVVPLRDVFLNQIDVPAGKHPVVLTFDDSTVGQFRYLIDGDGAVEIDPESAVGIMETFYAEHPDFGRGGFFGVLPYACFNWQGETLEDDQTPYCEQKLRWLLDSGYEIGNHTLNHASIQDIDDETFKMEVGGAIEALQEIVPEIKADIFVVPFGMYPLADEREQQREWMRSGFEYNGRTVQLLGSLQVGSEPAFSPVSVDWDPMWTSRIQACDGQESCLDYTWKPIIESEPERLYTSDGDPNTITIASDQPPALDGTFDLAKAEDKEVIEYDPETGDAR